MRFSQYEGDTKLAFAKYNWIEYGLKAILTHFRLFIDFSSFIGGGRTTVFQQVTGNILT